MSCAPCKQRRKIEIAEQRLGNTVYEIDHSGNIIIDEDNKGGKGVLNFLMKFLLTIILLPILLVIAIFIVFLFIFNSIIGKETVLDIRKMLNIIIKNPSYEQNG